MDGLLFHLCTLSMLGENKLEVEHVTMTIGDSFELSIEVPR
jgi:hypothetical protein